MNKQIYLYFAKSTTYEAWQEINKIAIRHDTSVGIATGVYIQLKLDDMAEIGTCTSELDKLFGLVFQKFIQAPKIDASLHYEGSLTLPMLIVDNPQVINKPTDEVLELTKKQWQFIGECLENRLGVEFLEVRDDLISREEILADIQRPSRYDVKNYQIVRGN